MYPQATQAISMSILFQTINTDKPKRTKARQPDGPLFIMLNYSTDKFLYDHLKPAKTENAERSRSINL